MMFGRSIKRRSVFENNVIFRDWSNGNFFDSDADPGLAALLSIVDSFGEYAFDTDEVKAQTVRKTTRDWLRHIIEGSPAPDGSQKAPAEGPQWRGLSRYVSTRRRSEQDYVGRSMSGFRELVWDFVRELSAVIDEDRSSNSGIRGQLGHLEQSVHEESLAELRKRILEAVRFINHSIEEREERQAQQMRQLGTRLRRMRAELLDARSQMIKDPLTQVFNRRSFDDQMRKAAQLHQLSGTGATLFLIDLDNFKEINDTLGHQAGDVTLKFVADCCIRDFPRESDYVARFGGDEFAIMIDEICPQICEMMGKRLLETVRERPPQWNGQSISVTVSLGIACLQPGEPMERWFERADRALREAKALGKNQLYLDPSQVVV